MKNLAIIPARGGSKRIPHKNIRDFLGKPIIAYSIESALDSRLFDEVMVSTDDEEIAKVAKEYGAKIPFMRSAETADDYATLSDVVEEVKDCYSIKDKSFNFICCILATAPLLKVSHLKKGYEMLVKEQNVDSVRPIAEFPYPIQRALKMENGSIELFNKQHKRTRSQDLEPAYYDAAQFYWMKWESGLKGDLRKGFVIPSIMVQDIDTLDDWKIAEFKYKYIFK